MTKPNRSSTWTIAVAVALVAALMVTTVALASSYTSSVRFDTTLTGAWRSYDGKNITIAMTSKCTWCASPANASQYFSVTLQRRSCYLGIFCSNADMSTYNLPNNGYGTASWYGVIPSPSFGMSYTFRFYFNKRAWDGGIITSSDVKMSSSQ